MEIRIKWKGRVFALTIGYKSPWHEQVYWIGLDEEFYGGDKSVYWADHIWDFWRPKEWHMR